MQTAYVSLHKAAANRNGRKGFDRLRKCGEIPFGYSDLRSTVICLRNDPEANIFQSAGLDAGQCRLIDPAQFLPIICDKPAFSNGAQKIFRCFARCGKKDARCREPKGGAMLFSLMHWPCSTTLLTIKKETGSWKWTALAAAIPTSAGIITCILFAAAARIIG